MNHHRCFPRFSKRYESSVSMIKSNTNTLINISYYQYGSDFAALVSIVSESGTSNISHGVSPFTVHVYSIVSNSLCSTFHEKCIEAGRLPTLNAPAHFINGHSVLSDKDKYPDICMRRSSRCVRMPSPVRSQSFPQTECRTSVMTSISSWVDAQTSLLDGVLPVLTLATK
jgi:hypothetical protein